MKRLLLLLTVCTMCISGVWARPQTIDGKVVDASTKSPPKAIPVAVQGSNIGSITSVYNGFAQESANGASLVISSVGFGGRLPIWRVSLWYSVYRFRKLNDSRKYSLFMELFVYG